MSFRRQWIVPGSMEPAVLGGRACYRARIWQGMDMQGKWGETPTRTKSRAQFVDDKIVAHNTTRQYQFSLMFPAGWEMAGMCLVHDYHGIKVGNQSMSVYANGPNLEWWIVNENPAAPGTYFTRIRYSRPIVPDEWLDLNCDVAYSHEGWRSRVRVHVNGALWFEDLGKPNAFPADLGFGAQMVVGPYVWDWSAVQNKRREVCFTLPESTLIL